MIRGRVVNVGGTDYIVPPFNVAMWEHPALNVTPDPNETPAALLRRMGEPLLENLARNYPDIDKAAILAELDVPTYMELRDAGMAMRHEPPNPQSAPAA